MITARRAREISKDEERLFNDAIVEIGSQIEKAASSGLRQTKFLGFGFERKKLTNVGERIYDYFSSAERGFKVTHKKVRIGFHIAACYGLIEW